MPSKSSSFYNLFIVPVSRTFLRVSTECRARSAVINRFECSLMEKEKVVSLWKSIKPTAAWNEGRDKFPTSIKICLSIIWNEKDKTHSASRPWTGEGEKVFPAQRCASRSRPVISQRGDLRAWVMSAAQSLGQGVGGDIIRCTQDAVIRAAWLGFLSRFLWKLFHLHLNEL